MAWLRHWDIVFGIPSPPKRGSCQLSCGEHEYSYVVHRGGYLPMCMDDLSCTCTKCVRSSCWRPLSSHQFWDGKMWTWWVGFQNWPEAGPKCIEEIFVSIWDDRLWDPKVKPKSFKKYFSSGFCCDILLAGRHNGHLWESVDDHENTVISMLSRRKAWHVIHGDGFPRSTRGR